MKSSESKIEALEAEVSDLKLVIERGTRATTALRGRINALQGIVWKTTSGNYFELFNGYVYQFDGESHFVKVIEGVHPESYWTDYFDKPEFTKVKKIGA